MSEKQLMGIQIFGGFRSVHRIFFSVPLKFDALFRREEAENENLSI